MRYTHPRTFFTLPSLLLAVPNVTAYPSTANVPTSYYSMWQYSCLCTQGLNDMKCVISAISEVFVAAYRKVSYGLSIGANFDDLE